MSKRNQIGTVTFANRPDPWKMYQALADAFDCKAIVASVRYRDTGREVPKRENAPADAQGTA